MIGLSYQLSPPLKDSLQKIEHLRRQILLAPLPRKTEQQLRFEAMINRLYWSLSLSENTLTRKEMINLVTKEGKEKLTKEQKEVVSLKKALDYISWEWLVSSKTVTPKTVIMLHELACPGSLRLAEGRLTPFLDYLQVNLENPIVQAGITQIQLIQLAPFTDGNGRTARLLALLFLYKYGYDFRGLLCLEEFWRKDLTGFRTHTETAVKTGSLTSWLGYFAKAAETQLEKIATLVSSPHVAPTLAGSFWEISDRQKEIVNHLEEPGASLTNRKIQNLFKVSQITASRDLAKLATLGLLFPHGKGRSVYYTKA